MCFCMEFLYSNFFYLRNSRITKNNKTKFYYRLIILKICFSRRKIVHITRIKIVITLFSTQLQFSICNNIVWITRIKNWIKPFSKIFITNKTIKYLWKHKNIYYFNNISNLEMSISIKDEQRHHLKGGQWSRGHGSRTWLPPSHLNFLICSYTLPFVRHTF